MSPPGDPSSPRRSPPAAPGTGAADDPGEVGARAERIRSGSMTALLQELAAIPEEALGSGWTGWLVPGAIVGRFEMVRELGRGGLGVVWEAHDRQLGRRVAFKAVRTGAMPALREERLLSEAEAAAKLSHPNIVTIHDVGRAEQGPYLVLELLEGETLEDRLGRGPMPVREAVRVAVEMAKGVAHAHGRGVVHRDLKPSNVVLCNDGQVKVLDFGMAYAFGRRRESGGTPAYMAPEQWTGAPEDERTDVFALGATLFQMLSGELAFPDTTRKPGTSWRRAAALEVPGQPALAELVASMLAKDPTNRPRDGEAVLAKLSAIQLAVEVSGSTPFPPVRARQRSPWRVLAPVAAAVLLATLLASWAAQRLAGPAAEDDGRLVVAVADFANETRDPDLDGLSGLLITSLEQSKSLRVVTRGRLIDLVREHGQGDAQRIDESTARAVGRKAGVRTLLLASIQKLGDTYAAELRAVDPQKDEYLFTLREQATAKNDLLPLIDRISDRTRLALREPEAEVKASEVKVGEAVTGNLEAYRHYFRGKDIAARGALREAVAEFKRAVEIEPQFRLAQVDLAWTGYLSGATRAETREILREASRNAKQVPEKEAGLLRILEAFFDGRFAASRAEIMSLSARFPEDRDLAAAAAQVLAWSGQFEDALPFFERALRLVPDWDFLRLDQAWLYAFVGKAEEGRRIAEEAARLRGTSTARVAAGLARYMAGDVDGGVSALRSSGAEDALSKAFLAQGLAAQGKIPEALATMAAHQDGIGDTTRAQVLAYAGRLREGLAILDGAWRNRGGDVAFGRQTEARYLAAAGDLERARKAAAEGDFYMAHEGIMLAAIGDEQRLGDLLREMQPASLHARFLRALSAHRKGDRKAALSDLRAVDHGTASFVPYVHGLVAAEAGLDEEAVEAFRRFERPAYWASDAFEAPWFLARARFLAARSLERLGRRDEARRVLDLQLARWNHADRDLPLLAEMKALRARLSADPLR